MTIQEFLDDIEDEMMVAGVKVIWDRFTLLAWASAELNRLSHEFSADCFHVHLDPAIATVSGTRYYDLPSNFGLNFVNAAGDAGDKYCCLLDDGTTESLIDYASTVQFYSQNLRGETSGKPTKYTVITASNGRKQIALSPPPDGSYEIDGLYIPTDWDLDTMDSIPPLPANSPMLKYAVLRRVGDKWETDYKKARADLAMEFARSRKAQFAPNLGGNTNSYTQMR